MVLPEALVLADPPDNLTRLPITFISHFRVKRGHETAFRELWASVAAALEADKPATAAYLGYLSADDSDVKEHPDHPIDLAIVHVFPDADAMAAHFTGADDRAAAAYEHIEPAGWEIYGAPYFATIQQIEVAAGRAGVPFSVKTDPLGGFLRTGRPR